MKKTIAIGFVLVTFFAGVCINAADFTIRVPTNEDVNNILRSTGALPPIQEGVLSEAYKGFMSGTVQSLTGFGATVDELGGGDYFYKYMQGVEKNNQQWNPVPEYDITSLAPENMSRTLGHNAGSLFLIPIIGIILISWFTWRILTKIRKRCYENNSTRTIVKYILAIISCFGIFILYIILGALAGWKHGGGALPMIGLLLIMCFTWRKITKNTKASEKGETK